MKSAVWKVSGFAVLVSLLASNPCRAADTLFSEAAAICVRNHADPEKVLSAADTAGWGTGFDKENARAFLEQLGLHLNPNVRLKEIGTARLFLKVEASLQSGAVVRSCNILGDNASWEETLEAAQNFFGAPPSQNNSQLVQWAYAEQGGQRLYFRGDQLKHIETLTGSGTLHVLSVVHNLVQSGPPAVMYKEVERAEGTLEDADAAYQSGNYAKLRAILTPLAEAGNADAQARLGFNYHAGLGVPKNDAEAVAWYLKAAVQGHVTAQFDLGVAYAYGQGVARNDAEAFRWFHSAADQGDPEAQEAVGGMYADGVGVQKNDVEAVAWYRKAAAQENAEGETGLGFMYENGRGVPRDDAEAVRWYRKAAAQGEPNAQASLGDMYATGRGVPRNDVEAYKWFSIAVPRFDEGDASERADAVKKRDALAARMTPADLAEAKRLAQEWSTGSAATPNGAMPASPH